MILKPTTWGDIWPYAYFRDKAGMDWKILEEKAGWLLVRNRDGFQTSFERPAPETPVTSLEMDFNEAMGVILTTFPGAQIIGEIPDPSRRKDNRVE